MSDDWKDALAVIRAAVTPGEDDSARSADDGIEPTDTAGGPTDCVKAWTLEIIYERKGRGGHPATIVVCPQGMSDDDVDALAGTLRRRLGVGGSARGGEILLQGDRRDALRTMLPSLGFKTKG